MATLESNGSTIHWESQGQGPCILMSHGFASSSEFWQDQVELLSPEWRTIVWDMRGHGQSEYPDDQGLYDEEHTTSDMLAILDEAGEGSAVLCGFSLGGYMSLGFWHRYPERVDALILYGTGPGFKSETPREKWNAWGEEWAQRLESGGLAELKGDLDKEVATTHRNAEGLVRVARGMFPQRDSHVIDRIAEIEVPTLIVVGEDDPLMDGSLYMDRKIPHSTLAKIPNTEHPASLEDTEAFNRVVREFLETIRGNE